MASYKKDDRSVSPVDCGDNQIEGWRRPCSHKGGWAHCCLYSTHEVKGPLLISKTQQARSQLSNTEHQAFGVLS